MVNEASAKLQNNPIANSFKQMLAISAGRVVGNIVLAVTTFGIGNIIMETAANAILLINGILA